MVFFTSKKDRTETEDLGIQQIRSRLGREFKINENKAIRSPSSDSARVHNAGVDGTEAHAGDISAATTAPPEPIPVPDPESEPVREPEKKFISHFTGLSARLRNLCQAEGSLMSILAQSLKLSPQILLVSFIINLLGLALPLAILQIYDRILPNQSFGTLTLLTIGLIIAFVLEAVLKIFRSYLMGWEAVHHGFQTQVDAVNKMLSAQPSQTGKYSSTTWLDSLDAIDELSAFEGSPSRIVLVDIPLTGIFLLVIALIGGPLVLVPIVLIAAFGTLTFLNGITLQESLTHRVEQDNRQSDFLVECLHNIHTLKGLALESQIMRRFERLRKTSALASYETIMFGNKLQAHGMLFANLMMISIVSCGALIVMSGQMSVGSLACCSLLSGRLTQPVLRGIGMWAEIQNIQLAQKRASTFDELTTAPEMADVAQQSTPRGEIILDNVCFGYGGKDENFLRDISLHVAPGEFIGIRGEDGSGRSTFVQLISGALSPEQGKALIDGRPAHEMQLPEMKHHIGYVSANTAIFKGTILENVTMFRNGDAIQDARDATRLIGLEEDINLLPDGFDTMLGIGGSEALSSGLLQRITIARALLSRPKILIINEANSLMDFKSDGQFKEGLSSLKGETTAILISNRPSFLAIADTVYELTDRTLRVYSPPPPPAAQPVPAPAQSVA